MTAGRLPIRLVCLDLDGTVLGAGREIRPRTREAGRRTDERDIRVVIATGRMYRTSLRYARELGVPGPLICYQGAYIRELPQSDAGEGTGALLQHWPMRPQVALAAVDWARAHGLDPHLNVDDELVMEVGDEGAADYERLSGITAQFVPDLRAAIDRPVTKVLAVGPTGLPERVLADARSAFGERAQVTVSHPEYLEWTAPGIHKGRAVRWLARRLRVPIAQVFAVGDQFNDLEMLAGVGHGVAMGDAPQPVQDAARHVTAGFADDGAARAIERVVLGDGRLP